MSHFSGKSHPVPDPYAVFRPRRGRLVAILTAAGTVLVFLGLALVLPRGESSVEHWGVGDRVAIALFGVAIATFLLRYARIRAVPTPSGLVVQNLMTRRRLEWPQIVRVQFASGAPWVSLELDDTDTVAVMAIQRSDGPWARAEASRLSALVQAHSQLHGR